MSKAKLTVKQRLEAIKKDVTSRVIEVGKELNGNKVNAEHQEASTFKMPDRKKVKAEIYRRLATTSKATSPNPKNIVGSTKAAMLLFPPIALVHAVDAMMDGAGKYEPYNWRAKDILLMGYLHAAVRHVIDYMEGEECAPDSRAKHLGHAIATLAIVLDAEAHGCLIDDRPDGDGGGVALGEALREVMEHEAFRKARREGFLKPIERAPCTASQLTSARKKVKKK